MFDTVRSWLGLSKGSDASDARFGEASLRRADGGPRRVAVFVDASNESEFAFRWALANLIDKERDAVTLVSVASPKPFADAPLLGTEVDAPLETASEATQRAQLELAASKDQAARILAHLAAVGKDRGVERLETAVIASKSAGLAGHALCEYAAQSSTDVAVVGSHGRTYRSMLLAAIGLGSVSDHVARGLQCPVTIVKHKPQDLLAATKHARSARQEAEHAALEARQKEQEALRRRQKGL
jgi:nucleotide-binding universal stress UspA family protein